MKIEDVPQDSKYLKNSVMRDVTYAVDKDGHYRAVASMGWTPKNDALEVTLGEIDGECREIAERVKAGLTSPLEYYMEKNIMTIDLLSAYTGIPKRKIRKHFNPEVFAALDEATLEKYADALRMTADRLKHIPAV